jgi:hypothetical protein
MGCQVIIKDVAVVTKTKLIYISTYFMTEKVLKTVGDQCCVF